MEYLLNNPVYNALISGDAALSRGNDKVKFFDEEVSPFAGFDEKYPAGFDELHELLPEGRRILYACRQQIETPAGWKLKAFLAGLQFVLDKYTPKEDQQITPVPLGEENTAEMVKLAALTKPGPFNRRTIEFGSYFGIFQNGQLAAMTGQRLHLPGFTEISAVCTHPDHAGKGYAGALMHHQAGLIVQTGKTPFLHVRADNAGAIALYKKMGFTVSGPMNFYFLEKK